MLMANGIDSLSGATFVRTIFSILSRSSCGAFLQAGIIRGAAQITRGRKPDSARCSPVTIWDRCCWPAC